MSLFGKKTEPKPPPRVEAPPPALPARPRFAIDDAVRLLKTLPVDDNASLVLFVIKNTLASLNVDIDGVIEDGRSKQERLSSRIAELRALIDDLERQADVHRAEIATVELDLAETTAAKDRLELAKQVEEPGTVPGGMPLGPPAITPPGAAPLRSRSGRPPPKPPPRKPPPEPTKEATKETTKDEASKVESEGPESDLFAMLPDSSGSSKTD